MTKGGYLAPESPSGYVLVAATDVHSERDLEQTSLLYYASILLKRRWLILFACMLGALSAYLNSTRLPFEYQSKAIFLVAEKTSSGKVGNEISGVFAIGDPVSYYKKIALSSLVLDQLLVHTFPHPRTGDPVQLSEILGLRDKGLQEKDQARRTLAKWIELANERSFPNIITLTVTSTSADLSSGIANALVSSLKKYDAGLRSGNEQERIDFIQTHLEDTELALKNAEKKLQKFLEQNRALANIPRLEIERGRLERDIELHEALFKTLTTEGELARIGLKKDVSAISVIDEAVAPQFPSGPKTSMHVGLGTVSGLMLGLMFCFCLEFFSNLSPDRIEHREFLRNWHETKSSMRRLLFLGPKKQSESPEPITGENLTTEP